MGCFLTVDLGCKTQLIDCAVEEAAIGKLRFQLVGGFDEISFPGDPVGDLRNGNALGRNQSAFMAFGAGVDWCLQGQPHRMPADSRVKFSARELRAILLKEATYMITDYENHPRVLARAPHDVRYYAHGRDIRRLRRFLLSVVRCFSECAVRVVGITNTTTDAIHVFDSAVRNDPIYMLDSQGNLRWASPAEYNRPAEWLAWTGKVGKVVRQPDADWRNLFVLRILTTIRTTRNGNTVRKSTFRIGA